MEAVLVGESYFERRKKKRLYLFGSLWDFDIQYALGQRNNLSSGIGSDEEEEAIIQGADPQHTLRSSSLIKD